MNTKLSPRPIILVGGLEQGEYDLAAPGLIAVSYPSLKRAEAAAEHLLSAQNGTQPFTLSTQVRAGDTAIHVDVAPKPLIGKGYLCRVMLKANPKHLTHSFYVSSFIPVDEFDTFSFFYEKAGHYVFTTAHGEALLLSKINLIKYVLTRRGV